eukprot:12483661-Alexandrium_andersonii.AAC.1
MRACVQGCAVRPAPTLPICSCLPRPPLCPCPARHRDLPVGPGLSRMPLPVTSAGVISDPR